MQKKLSDKECQALMDRLKQDLRAFPKGSGTLEQEFESAAKHIPAYLKIVKGHIEQLAKVLELEAHDHRKLESVGLAEPVTQLIQLFRDLNEEDLQLLESLAYESKNWDKHSMVAASQAVSEAKDNKEASIPSAA